MYDELDYLSPEILNDVENKIASQQQKYLLPIENNPKNWIDNELVYVDDIKTIEDKIDDMRKFFDITVIPKRDWNLEGVNNISYVDINRWLKNLETLGKIKLKLTQISNNPLNIVNSVGLSLRNYVCYGNIYQETTTGSQLYNVNDAQTITSGITVDEEGWISVSYDNTSGTSTKYFRYFTNNLNLQLNTQYSIITEIKEVSGNLTLYSASRVNNGGQFVNSVSYTFDSSNSNLVYKRLNTTIESFDGVVYGLRTFVQFLAGQSGSIKFRLSVIEDTTITENNFVYEPYTNNLPSPSPNYPQNIQTISGEIELKNIGKNLFDLGNSLINYFATSTNGTKINKSVNIEDYVSATFTENSITITNYNNSGYRWLSKQITLNKNTDYTISGQNSNIIKILGFSSLEEGSIGTQLSYIDNQNLKPPKTFNSGDYEYYVISMYPPTSTTIENLQIEEGTVATEGELYKELITTIHLGDNELVKIGDVADKLNVDELGNITITKNIGKIVLNGSENWQEFYMTKTNTNVFSINSTYLNNNYQNTYNKITALSDYFKCYGLGTLYENDDIEAIELNSNTSYSIQIGISKDIASSVSEFKQWLSENNVIVYYQLATPTTIELGNINIPILQGNSYLYTNANLEPTNISCKYLEYDGNYKPLLPSSNLYPSNTLLPTNNKGE